MRWAQGWFQVSYKHLEQALRSRKLSVRQKLGLLQLLGWREFYPWLSVQVIPILLYHTYLGPHEGRHPVAGRPRVGSGSGLSCREATGASSGESAPAKRASSGPISSIGTTW